MKKIIKKIFSIHLIDKLSSVKTKYKLNKLKNEILELYINKEDLFLDKDLSDAIDYLKANQIEVFPYEFISKYAKQVFTVNMDEDSGLKYVIHENSRLYFKRDMQNEQIEFVYRCILMEQDIESPHRYLINDFTIEEGDVVYDIGAAEGNFSLSVAEKAKHIYIFEADKNWIEALAQTFKPWKEKVTIVNKVVSNKEFNDFITLDTFIKNNLFPNFIKIDVDGGEKDLIKGSKTLFESQSSLKIDFCTYHKQSDYEEYLNYFSDNGFKCKPSKNYMLMFYFENFIPPFFRRGLLRCEK